MTKLDEITVVKYETEFVAKHKDFDVIGVGGNEFEAVLELSKALGALMFSKEAEHEVLEQDVTRYFELKQGIPPLEDEMNYQFAQKYRLEDEPKDECYFRISNEFYRLEEKLSKVGKEK